MVTLILLFRVFVAFLQVPIISWGRFVSSGVLGRFALGDPRGGFDSTEIACVVEMLRVAMNCAGGNRCEGPPDTLYHRQKGPVLEGRYRNLENKKINRRTRHRRAPSVPE